MYLTVLVLTTQALYISSFCQKALLLSAFHLPLFWKQQYSIIGRENIASYFSLLLFLFLILVSGISGREELVKDLFSPRCFPLLVIDLALPGAHISFCNNTQALVMRLLHCKTYFISETCRVWFVNLVWVPEASISNSCIGSCYKSLSPLFSRPPLLPL